MNRTKICSSALSIYIEKKVSIQHTTLTNRRFDKIDDIVEATISESEPPRRGFGKSIEVRV